LFGSNIRFVNDIHNPAVCFYAAMYLMERHRKNTKKSKSRVNLSTKRG